MLNKVPLEKKSFVIGIISLGTLLEWAEYTFYGYMAFTLSSIFFPTYDPQVAILKTFGIFAAGYLMRPIGAILFGHIGDRLGRKPALMLSLCLMGIATMGIGFLPTYSTLGAKASFLLLCLRLLQGLAISGEYNGAGIFLVERNTTPYPCLMGSWVSASAAAGMVLGGIAAFIVSLPAMPVWAWRVPFLLGGISCFIGLGLRKQVNETPLFLQLKSSFKRPLLEVIQHYPKELFFSMAIAAFTGIFVYTGNIFMVVFLKQYVNLSAHHATFYTLLGELIVVFAIPLAAYWADRTDPYRLYASGLISIGIFSPLIFLLAASGQNGLIVLAMILYGLLNGLICGPMVKILCDQFPPALRYTGISFAWGVAAALFSGTAPMIAQSLSTHFSWIWGPSLYVSITALLTCLITDRLRKYPLQNRKAIFI